MHQAVLPLKAMLIDDESDSLHILESMIGSHLSDKIEIIGQESDPRIALRKIEDLNPDLLFLDIDMPYMNGFELLEKTDTSKLDVVFTTAYDKYALQAFRTSAVEFLLKPVKLDDLSVAIKKVVNSKLANISFQTIPFLLEQVKAINNNQVSKIALPTNEGISFLNIEEILYCESDDAYSTVFLSDNTNLLLSKSLRSLETLMQDFEFLRIHRSWLINLNHIKQYLHQDGGTILMTDGKKVPLARSRKQLFTQIVKQKFPNLLS